MPLPTWDVFIGLIFMVGVAYGFILRRDKTITTLCSVYIGLVIANSFSQTVFDFFNGNKIIGNQLWIRSNVSLATISIALLLLSIVFVSGSINSTASRAGEMSLIEIVVYSSLTIAIILSSTLNFLPEESRLGYLEASRLAKILFEYRTLILLVPPISLVVLNFRHK